MNLKNSLESLQYWRESAQTWRRLGNMREWARCMKNCKLRIKWIREEFVIR